MPAAPQKLASPRLNSMAVKVSPQGARASCHCLTSLSASSKIRVVEPRRQPPKAGFATLKQHGSEGFSCHCLTSVLASSKTRVVEPCRQPPKVALPGPAVSVASAVTLLSEARAAKKRRKPGMLHTSELPLENFSVFGLCAVR